MDKQQSYSQLLELVRTGKLQILGTGGLPRALTSATAKFLGEGRFEAAGENSCFDLVFHEPFVSIDNRDKEGGVWEALLEPIKLRQQDIEASGVNLEQQPLRVLVKNNSFHLTPTEWKMFIELISCYVINIRNPALVFPSLAKALCNVGIIRNPADKDVLQRAIDADDYSGLGAEHSRYFSCHIGVEHPDYKCGLWESLGFHKDVCCPYLGVQSHDFATLPENLGEPLIMRRLGWRTLQSLTEMLQEAGKPYCVVDATDIQLASEKMLENIFRFSDFTAYPTSMRPNPIYQTTPDVHAHLFNGSVNENDSIRFPSKRPSTPDKLPSFLKDEISYAFALYTQLMSSNKRIALRGADYSKLMEIDPVFLYVAAQAKNISLNPSALRSQNPAFEGWFEFVDAALRRTR